MAHSNKRVFITGGTGYMGRRLIPLLGERGYEVIALTREESRHKLPSNCTAVLGNALDGHSYTQFVEGAGTFIQLVGVAHPSPSKAEQFRAIDRTSGLEAVRVASDNNVPHFVYVSVAQPAPLMKSYLEARMLCEAAIRQSNLSATILRPWYVLGPGHRWPYCLAPLYKLAELLPMTRDGARRLGLVTLRQMLATLLYSVNHPARGVSVLGVPEIRAIAARRMEDEPLFASA